MAECYSIYLKMDPLVYRWLEARFKSSRGVFHLGDSWYYGLVSALLYQSPRVGAPAVVPAKYDRFVPARVCITEYDFYHYGWEVSVTQELRFSRLMRNIIIDECLRNAAILRARYDMPLSRAIGFYTVYYGLEEEDVKFETLRKTYRRHYRGVEDEYRALDRAAVTDFGALEDAAPPPKTLRIRKPRPSDPAQLTLFDQTKHQTLNTKY